MRPTHNVINGHEEVPPSTLAAQIVHKIEDASERTRASSSRAHVRELLKLILEDVDQSNGSQRTSSEAIEENRRLIVVIVRLCVTTITGNDPFEDRTALQVEAAQCLAVVELTVRKYPETLFQPPRSVSGTKPAGAIVYWLIPCLVQLYGNCSWINVQDAALKALQACLSIESKPVSSTAGLHIVTRILQGCAGDLLTRMSAFIEFNDATASSTAAQVPSARTLAALTVKGRSAHDDTYIVPFFSVREDLQCVIGIISACVLPKTQANGRKARYRHGDIGWAMRCLSTVLITQSDSTLLLLDDQSLTTIFDLLSACISQAEANRDPNAPLRLVQIACRALSNYLASDMSRTSDASEVAGCRLVASIIQVSQADKAIVSIYLEQFDNLVQTILSDLDRRQRLSPDLQRALACLSHLALEDEVGRSSQLLDFDNLILKEIFEEAVLTQHERFPEKNMYARPTKRFRSIGDSTIERDKPRVLLQQEIRKLSGLSAASRINSLEEVIESFSTFSVDDQCLLISALADAACVNATGSPSLRPCTGCRTEAHETDNTALIDPTLGDDLFKALENLTKQTREFKATRPRVAALLALRRLLAHSTDKRCLDMQSTYLGQACLQSLRSSSRDVRLAALTSLKHYFSCATDSQISHNNRLLCLDLWRSLTEQNELVMQETCIQGLGLMCRSNPDEDEMNMILLGLVNYLGHPNAFMSCMAYEELSKLGTYENRSLSHVFEPYWRVLGVSIVKSLSSRPQIAQSICDLLGTSMSDLLKHTQFYTLPYLVFKGQLEILQRIAQANGPDVTVHSLCFKHGQLAAILCFLLLQPSEDSDTLVVQSMFKACGGFEALTLPDLLKCDTMYMAYELLKAAGENEENTTQRALQLLQALAELSHGRTRSSRSSQSTRKEASGHFFETWALAIVSLLSEAITNAKGVQPVFERKRCIGAIGVMATLARDRLGYALPQIKSCLQFAVQDAKLRDVAFMAWLKLLFTLNERNTMSILDQTFALLVHYWDSLSSSVQAEAHQTLSHVFVTHSDGIKNDVQKLPSLAGIPLLSKLEADLAKFRDSIDARRIFAAFAKRCQSETTTVVSVALGELESYLTNNLLEVHSLVVSEQPDPAVGTLTRSILDACVRFKDHSKDVTLRCARCLGLLGCLDPFRVDIPVEKKEMFVLWNFDDRSETVDFVLFFLEEILVKVYLATTATNRQQILAFGMQELLKACDMEATVKCRRGAADEEYQRWIRIDESTRNILTPFLTSKYVVNAPTLLPVKPYPIFNKVMRYTRWINELVLDLLQRGKGDNACLVFDICRRLVRNQDASIANFLLPYVTLNVVVEGSEQDVQDVAGELLHILSTSVGDMNATSRQNIIQCSQSVFSVVDYLSRWVQEKRRSLASLRTRVANKEQQHTDFQINRIESLLAEIPTDIMSRRAADCQSFSRALFYWEQHIRRKRSETASIEMQPLYTRLQEIYMQIDEPDGIEGLSFCIQSEGIEQQILEDRNAGRWTAVQSWYELQLADEPGDVNAQLSLAKSLTESGQHDAMLNLVSDLREASPCSVQLGSYAVEASWMTGRWDKLVELTSVLAKDLPCPEENFNIGVANVLRAMMDHDVAGFEKQIEALLLESIRPLTATSTATLQGCHVSILQLHILLELDIMSGQRSIAQDKQDIRIILDNRLEMLGTFPSDQKYLLGIRRAAMQLAIGSDDEKRNTFSSTDVSATLLKTAKLARKGGYLQHAMTSVLRAMHEGSPPARIEYARLMWSEGHHRRAIRTLEDAIALNAFGAADIITGDSTATVSHTTSRQNPLSARAHLLLAKWIDRSGQTASNATVERYRTATRLYPKWEKGFYLLGKHYNKLLESEKTNLPEKQAQTYITGEMAKLVIENFVRSLSGGTKYIYQTLPKLLTLWLDFGAAVEEPLKPNQGDQNFRDHIHDQRKKVFGVLMKTVEKYIQVRLPAYVFYTAFSQVVARITHPNKEVYALLVEIVVKVILEHPQQAMWPLLAMMKSKASSERARRGGHCKMKLLKKAEALGSDRNGIPEMLSTGHKLTGQLVELCDKPVDQHVKNPVSMQQQFGFVHRRVTPCRLVIPVESTLLAKLPPVTTGVRNWKAFAKESVVTIDQFLDEATVLSSLAKPRRVKVRGSNGQIYSLLCKPKDDLRKDQRLLEFNSMISRILKRDAECSKRRLYIKTYAVTPLNEECGLIEWVDGMRTLRDILLNGYRQRGISIEYETIRAQLNTVSGNPDRVNVFTSDILGKFPPILHDWFVDQFREPDTWFAARLRYTRSCAVMSMVGHVLGLGDRHGENILLEEAAGGTFHVDFNCLFDKGKTFETPERVPFRLTHNMVDAFGAYRENGPFRRSCELAMGILRQNEDTLMTILETFLYDPTQDFIGKRRPRTHNDVPTTPQGVLESVRNKVRGLLPTESLPLSVEGYVQLQIQEATDPYNLARMYIGWSAFL